MPFLLLRQINFCDGASDTSEQAVMADSQPPELVETVQALAHVQKIWNRMRDHSPIYHMLLSDVRIVSASKAGFITAHLRVTAAHLNSKGSLHGTVSACLVDWAGGLAIAATGRESSGVSTDIHTSYISGAKEGDLLEVRATATKVGGTLAFTIVEIRKIEMDGTCPVVATGSHTKYVKQ